MTRTTSSLETFDFLELLYMLSEQERSGVLTVYRPDGNFQAWLERGRVMHMQFDEDLGASALVRLMLEPHGRFQFDEGLTHPAPKMDTTLDDLAMEAMEALPLQELPFEGPARITSPERLHRMRWSLKEQDFIQQLTAQKPVIDLSGDPEARRMLQKLHRIGLIAQRKSRVARLTVSITRQVQGVAVIDDLIFKRWKEDIVRHPQQIAVKTDDGQVYTFPVRSGPDLGTQLLVPPELLVRTGLRAGDSVLVRPV